MLIYVAIILVIVFFILLQTGLLDSLSAAANQQRRGDRHREPERIIGKGHDPEAEKRLAIFRDFIERLENSDEEEV